MRHRLSGLSTYGLKGHAWEMSTQPTIQQEYGPLYHGRQGLPLLLELVSFHHGLWSSVASVIV